MPSITNGQDVRYSSWATDYIPVNSQYDYVVSAGETTGSRYVFFYTDNSYLGYTDIGLSYTLNNYAYWEQTTRIRIRLDSTSDPHGQLEIGTTATPYTPYSGASLSVAFPESVGTVYSGTIDPVTGEGVVTHKCVDMGAMTWDYITNDGTPYYYRGSLIDRKAGAFDLKASIFKTSTASGTRNLADLGIVGSTTTGYVFVRYDAYPDAAQFKTAVSGAQLLYELADPIPFTIPPQSLTPPAGDAYIWADCGSTAEVTYIGKA